MEIEYTGAKGAKYGSPTSRYADSDIVYYGDVLTYPIYKKASQSKPFVKFYEIPKENEYRPDLVSYFYYGAPDFWWKIMEVNGMKDVLEFRAGRNIALPDNMLTH